MSSPDRAEAALPVAAALVCAVVDNDQDEVARILDGVTDWHALVVVLAGHVPDDSPISIVTEATAEQKAAVIVRATARRFRVSVARIQSRDRTREALDARAVAMAAMRYAGLSSPFIGRYLDRDHSTVLYSATRVGETPRLHRAAIAVADLVGIHTGDWEAA